VKFGVRPLRGLICADIGASTGGFTDVLSGGVEQPGCMRSTLRRGLLHWRLRQDPRVVVDAKGSMRTRARGFSGASDLIVVDVSFNDHDARVLAQPQCSRPRPTSIAYTLVAPPRRSTSVKPPVEAPMSAADQARRVDPEFHRAPA